MQGWKKSLFIVLSLNALTACDAMDDNAGRVGSDVHNWYDNSRYRLSTYIYDQNRRAPQIPPLGAPRYCYRVQTDIMCYTEPLANAQNRFVAGQDDQGYLDSVRVEAPSASVATTDSISPYQQSYSSSEQHSALGGNYSGPPDVAPPLDTVSVGDAPPVSGQNGKQPFYYVQSPSTVDSMDGVHASYDTSKAKGMKEKPIASPAKDAAISKKEPGKAVAEKTAALTPNTSETIGAPASIPPSLLEDTAPSKMGNTATPVSLLSKN